MRRNTFLVMNLGLDVVDDIRATSNSLSGEGFDKDLHAAARAETE